MDNHRDLMRNFKHERDKVETEYSQLILHQKKKLITHLNVLSVYRVFHNCWNKAIVHKSRILN